MAGHFAGINPVYFWCIMLLVGRILGEVPPPTIKEGRHVSLNAIRVEWDVTVSSGNGSDDITSFTVGLSTDNCTHFAQRKDVSDVKFKTWTFYDVDAETRAACVKTVTTNGTSSWASINIRNEENRPPSIVQGPDSQKIHYFSADFSENKVLTCIVKGKPKPTVTWTVNGKVIKSGTKGYSILPNGSLSIDNVADQHRGAYRCIAKNDYGKALSDIVSIQQAELRQFPFEEVRDYPIHTGSSLIIPCRQRPYSVPEGTISWFKETERNGNEDVAPDHKRAIGPNGELIFVYVVPSDAGTYKCDVWNDQLNMGVDGSISKVRVEEGHDFDTIRPNLLEKSSESILAYVGETARITCIFSGRPSPDIIWKRVRGRLDHRHKTVDNNRTLEIFPVKQSDSGTYECEGSNMSPGGGRMASQPEKFKLIVHARPTWEIRPQSVNATVGDEVRFRCRADGNPMPEIQWYINGEAFQGQATSKYLIEDNDLVIQDVQKGDMMNIQCNASNSIGYLYSDAFLNVVFPTMIVRPPQNVTLTPGGVMTFECGVESDPGTPVSVQWLRGDEPINVEKGRIYVTDNHSLVINTTNEEDGGRSFVSSYTCVVSNSVHDVRARAKLRPTGGGETQVKIQASREHGERKELSLIGLCGALVSVVVICLVLFFIYRKRQQKLMKRSGLPCDDSELPLLPYLDDDILKNKIKEVLIIRNRIDLGRTLGKGQFGRVYEGVLRDERGKMTARVAVKTLKYKPEETEIVELFLREAVMMKDFWHAHVLSLIGISVDDDGSPMVILPLMENSDLRIYVQDPEKEITVLELLKLGHQVAQGMVYLSNMRFIHRDLAARNCMVDLNRVVKVADFGLSRDLFSRDYYRIEDGKTPLPVRWMAPESLSKSIFTTLSDVWSYGVLLWELMTRGAVPYPDVDNWDIAHFIQTGKRLAQPVYCPDSIYNIMLACWEDEPSNRPTFERIVKDIDVIIDSAKSLPKASSHLYLNIHSMATVSDYRDVTHTTV